MNKNKIISMFNALDYSALRQFPELSSLWFVDNSQNVRGLLEILDSAVVPHLDFKNAVRQDTTFIPENLRKHVSDLLYSIPIQKDSVSASERETLPVYVLVEHQSTVDRKMAYRLHAYMMQVWSVHLQDYGLQEHPQDEWGLPAVIGIVFYTGDRKWSVPLSLRELANPFDPFRVYVPECRFLLLDVKHTEAATLTQPDHLFG